MTVRNKLAPLFFGDFLVALNLAKHGITLNYHIKEKKYFIIILNFQYLYNDFILILSHSFFNK